MGAKPSLQSYDVQSKIPEFINVYCELDPKNRMPMTEFISALYEFITKIKNEKLIMTIDDILCTIKFVFETKYPRALSIRGPRNIDASYELLYICGARLRFFPALSIE